MERVGIVTDSNSGLSREEADILGIKVVPMPFAIDGVEFYEGVTIERKEFFDKLSQGAAVKSSQPSPEVLMGIWDEMLGKYESVVYIPVSSGLSSSVMTTKTLAEDYDGRVYVVDNHRISCTQKMSVLEAIKMRESGFEASRICEVLEENKMNASIYIAVDTVEY